MLTAMCFKETMPAVQRRKNQPQRPCRVRSRPQVNRIEVAGNGVTILFVILGLCFTSHRNNGKGNDTKEDRYARPSGKRVRWSPRGRRQQPKGLGISTWHPDPPWTRPHLQNDRKRSSSPLSSVGAGMSYISRCRRSSSSRARVLRRGRISWPSARGNASRHVSWRSGTASLTRSAPAS